MYYSLLEKNKVNESVGFAQRMAFSPWPAILFTVPVLSPECREVQVDLYCQWWVPCMNGLLESLKKNCLGTSTINTLNFCAALSVSNTVGLFVTRVA